MEARLVPPLRVIAYTPAGLRLAKHVTWQARDLEGIIRGAVRSFGINLGSIETTDALGRCVTATRSGGTVEAGE